MIKNQRRRDSSKIVPGPRGIAATNPQSERVQNVCANPPGVPPNNVDLTPADLLRFFNCIRRSKNTILGEFTTPLAFCEALLHPQPSSEIALKAKGFLAQTPSDLRDYQIASAYALLIGNERRKELSAYFTPPALTAATISAAAPFLAGKPSPSILDPACGGGAFLVPLARALVTAQIKRRTGTRTACLRTIEQLQGIELDEGLAALSRRLLASMFDEEFGVALGRETRSIIRRADSLTTGLDQRFDLVVGNPPYGRIGSRLTPTELESAGLANNGGHTNFYSLFLMRALEWVKPGGGLVFILPTSFVAGPYFSGLRQEILDRADVVRIDLHEQRENLFVGAVQDVCMLTLRRHSATIGRTHHTYQVGIVDAAGGHKPIGSAETPTNGEPWMLPVATDRRIIIPSRLAQRAAHYFTLADYGYRVRVGKVVPTREREALRSKPEKGTLPLLWASAVRPDGSFSAAGGARSKNQLWFRPSTKDVAYATKAASVLVQRTSNRDQNRRLNAAPVCPKFLKLHRQYGFVAENHVIVLEAMDNPRVPPTCLAQILNSQAANERFSAVSGSFSVSAKILGRLALPDPDLLPLETDERFTAKIEACFDSIDGVLVPLTNVDGAQRHREAAQPEPPHRPR